MAVNPRFLRPKRTCGRRQRQGHRLPPPSQSSLSKQPSDIFLVKTADSWDGRSSVFSSTLRLLPPFFLTGEAEEAREQVLLVWLLQPLLLLLFPKWNMLLREEEEKRRSLCLCR